MTIVSTPINTPHLRPLRALIYNRVSTDRADHRSSVEAQEAANSEVCRQHQWHLAGSYTDNDRSASRFATREREDWPRLLSDLENGYGDVLILWEPSRGDRKPSEWMRLLDLCRDRGILIHITSHGHTYDVRNLRDWRILAEEGIDSYAESEKTSLRVRRHMERLAMSGRPHGKLLYGYRREYSKGGKLLRQVADEVPRVAIAPACLARHSGPMAVELYTPAGVIREMAARVLEGETTFSIAADLNRRGIRTPRPPRRGTGEWRLEQVRDQLLNPGYIARRVHRGRDVGPAAWPPLLDEVTFHSVVAKLTDPARKTQRDGAIKHLLSGIATCGVCGGQMRVLKNRGSLSYQCWARPPGTGIGFHVTRVKHRLDAFVTDAIIHRLARPDALAVFASGGQPRRVREAMEEAAMIRDRLNSFYAEAAAGRLSAAGLARIEADLLPKIEAAERRARPVHLSPLVAGLADPDPEVVAERWAELDVVQQREVIRALTTAVRVLPPGQGRRSYDDWVYTEIVWRSGEEGGD